MQVERQNEGLYSFGFTLAKTRNGAQPACIYLPSYWRRNFSIHHQD